MNTAQTLHKHCTLVLDLSRSGKLAERPKCPKSLQTKANTWPSSENRDKILFAEIKHTTDSFEFQLNVNVELNKYHMNKMKKILFSKIMNFSKYILS